MTTDELEDGDFAPGEQPGTRRRATDAEIEVRVQTCYNAVRNGLSLRDIVSNANSSGWGVSPVTVGRYLATARKRIKEDFVRDRQEHLAEHTAVRQTLLMMARVKGDIALQLKILDSMARIQGLMGDTGQKIAMGAIRVDPYPPPVTVTNPIILKMSGEERDKMRNALTYAIDYLKYRQTHPPLPEDAEVVVPAEIVQEKGDAASPTTH